MENKMVNAIMYIVPRSVHVLDVFVMKSRIMQQLDHIGIKVHVNDHMLNVTTECEDINTWSTVTNGEWPEYFPVHMFKNKKEGDVIELVHDNGTMINITLQQKDSSHGNQGDFEDVLKKILE